MFGCICDNCDSTTILNRLVKYTKFISGIFGKDLTVNPYKETLDIMSKLEDTYGLCLCPFIDDYSSMGIQELLSYRCPCSSAILGNKDCHLIIRR